VRLVQKARKDAGLVVAHRITLIAKLSGPLAAAIELHAAYISGETLSIGLTLNSEPQGFKVEDEIDGRKLVFALRKGA